MLTPSDPNTGGNTALSTWFAASRTNLVPPIGTGLTPVSGDTADFLWPTTNASGTYTFDGAGWASAVGQVVAGNTIVNGTITGNTIANSTITGNNIIVGTVSGNVIIANTLAGNTVIANTLYGNAIIANTIYGNAIIANTINGNSIIANTISGNSIIANSFTANSINGSSISAGSIAANTINGGSIVSGSITTNQLAANVLTANTVVSTGATIGNFASPGFWLQGSTGNARFGNTVSIGNGLTVGNNASIGGNLTVGANLSVTGLVTSGSLISNTVSTLTIFPGNVSSSSGVQQGASHIGTNATLGSYYNVTGISIIDVPTPNAVINVSWNSSNLLQWSGSGTIYLTYKLARSVGGGAFTTLQTVTLGPFDPFTFRTPAGFGYLDTDTASYGYLVTYRYQVAVAVTAGTGSPTFIQIYNDFSSIIGQSLKR